MPLPDYSARRQHRIARLRARAERLRTEGDQRLASARAICDGIPLGQPILVGHHSERHARRDVERIHTGFRTGYAALKQADEVERRAQSAASNRAVSSDDPAAVAKLEAKLAAVEAGRERWKSINAALRIKDAGRCRAALDALALTASERQTLKYAASGTGYVVTNLGAEARRLRERIAELKRAAVRELPPDVDVNGVTVRETPDRLQIIFPGKPAAEIRSQLKHAGFRWAPSEGAWQRRPSYQAREAALRIAQEIQS